MAIAEDQLDALRDLIWLYSQAMLWGAPRQFEYVGADVERGREERKQLTREITHAQMDYSHRIREARKRLLATGYPVPDAWLTVRAVGQLSSVHTAAMKGKKETAILSDIGADLQALEVVCREMSVAALRLEAQVEPSDSGDKTGGKNTPVKESDMPLTLGEFMAAYCASDSRLTKDRRDSLAYALQSAARRKGSGVVLPKHVGNWRPGRKKYYRPSQLRVAWPNIVRNLPIVPPLKSVTP